MTARELLTSIKEGRSDKLLAELYGEPSLPFQKKRLAGVLRRLAARRPGAEVSVFRAPGRTELGGNHTDHQQGRVLAAAVDLDVLAAAVKTDDRRVTLSSPAYGRPIAVDLRTKGKKKSEAGKTESLVRGVAHYLGMSGAAGGPGGFDAEIDSTLPQGAGLSSSAAFEVLIGLIFNDLYLNGRHSAVELARIGQQAENHYYGKPCGLMDQIASAAGGTVAVDFRRPERPAVAPLALDPERAGYALFTADTGGGHAGLTRAYAAIPAEMKAIAVCFKKGALREVPYPDLIARLPELRVKTGDRAVLRALHFFAENERVAAQADLLCRGDFEGFLALVNESGDSSWEELQNCSQPEDPRRQGIALGLALSRRFLTEKASGQGAARVHGGGFAGSIQCYVPLAAAKAYRSFVESVFGKGSVRPLRLCPRGAIRII